MDLEYIAEVRIGEWNEGEYWFDKIGLTGYIPKPSSVNLPDEKNYLFQGISWGSSYMETADILAKKNMSITELHTDQEGFAMCTSYDLNCIGNERPNYIGLSYTLGDKEGGEVTRLYKVDCLFYLLMEYDIKDMKNQMITDYGAPVKDEITGEWNSDHWKKDQECVWESSDSKIVLRTDSRRKVYVTFSSKREVE